MSVLDNFIRANRKYNQGIDDVERGAYQKAAAELTRALRLNPRYTLAFINRGKLYQQHLHLNSKAVSDYQRALALDPRDDQTRDQLAKLLLEMKRFRKSADCFYRLLLNVRWNTKPMARGPLDDYHQHRYERAAIGLNRILNHLDFH